MNKWLEAAKPVREAMDRAGGMLNDAEASVVTAIYPTLKQDGQLVRAGTRINWYGQLKRAAVDLWDTIENNPDNAPVLWEDINYKDGYRIIPDVITAGTAFALDERGWWKDDLYESRMAANVYTPDEYPDGWRLVE